MHLLSAFRSQRRQLVLGNAPAVTDQALARSRLQGTNVLEARFVASLRIADKAPGICEPTGRTQTIHWKWAPRRLIA